MYLLLDNFDSFVYNLYAYMQELGQRILLKRVDEITLKEIAVLDLEGIIISPGPGCPSKAILSLDVINHFKGIIPILGVCLGHQTIAYSFGVSVEKGITPMHGKITSITHNKQGLFTDLPSPMLVTRYHSLAVDKNEVTLHFNQDAISEDGVVMAISHLLYPIYGVQFHPEAIQTEHGYALLSNFITICKHWRNAHENH